MRKKIKGSTIVIILLSFLVVCSICFYFFFDKLIINKSTTEEKEIVYKNNLKIKKLALVIANNQETEIVVEDNKNIKDYDSIKWESSDNSIIDVSSCKGKRCSIVGKKIGEATVTAKIDDHNVDSIIVSVAEPDKIYFYVSKHGNDYVFGVKKSIVVSEENNWYDEYYNLLTTYSCKTLDCNIVSSGNYHAVIRDNDLYEFNYKTSDAVVADDILDSYDSFNIIDNSKEILAYKFYENDNNNSENNRHILYSKFLSKEIISTKSYFYLISAKSLLEKNIGVFSIENKGTKFINLKNNEEVYSTTKDVSYIFDTNMNNHTIYGIAESYFYYRNSNTLYIDENYNELFDGNVFYSSNIINNKLYAIKNADDKEYYIYNFDGTYKTSTVKLNKILDIYDDCILAVNDFDKLVLLNLDGTEKIELYDWNNKYDYAYNSGYQTRDGKTGYFIILENSDIDYGTEGHAIVIYYNPSDGGVNVTEQGFTGMEGKAKPVLYLYPKKTTKVKVTLDGFSTLTTTYPKYNNGWEVTAKKNGDLYDKDGKYYYGLYWEEETPRLVDFSTGFYVTKDNAIDFLEEKLSYIGLNDKEKNEFIMYWLPILEKNKQNLVYFELTDELESYTHLNIKPKPDSLLRVTIHIKKVDHRVYIKEESLKSFERDGFVAVEWGGINYE